MSNETLDPSGEKAQTVKDNTEKKRKLTTKKNLIWSDVMLLNIFEEQELKLHDDEVDGVDLLNNDDYTGYFRIVDYVEEGSLPRDELNKVYLEHRNQMQQQNPQPTLMLRWWKVFANDPKHMSQVDQTWIRDNYPKSFEALKTNYQRKCGMD